MSLWKDVTGYEGLYIISDSGEVISLPRTVMTRNSSGDIVVHRKAKFIKPHTRGRGTQQYLAVTLSKNGKSKAYSLHRLVAMAFLPNPDGLPEVNHKDENPLNCNVNNLEWCTRQYNAEYSKGLKIAQYFDGEIVATYKSITFASKITGIARQAISNALCGRCCTAGGFEWKYCDKLERSDDLSH